MFLKDDIWHASDIERREDVFLVITERDSFLRCMRIALPRYALLTHLIDRLSLYFTMKM